MSLTPRKEPANLGARPVALAVQGVPWEAADVQAFRDYVARNPRFLIYLAQRTPVITGTTTEEVALSAKFHAGFEEAFAALTIMATSTDSEEKSPFIGNDEEPTA